jgi:hypothetical protein
MACTFQATKPRVKSIRRCELKTTSIKTITTGQKLGAVHPGTVPQADFINAMRITRYRVAKAIGLQPWRIDGTAWLHPASRG